MAPLFATSKLRHIGIFALVAGLYFVSGKFGLHYATISPSAAAVWAPSGIALAACLMAGDWAALPIFIAAFLVNLTTAGSFATSLGIACGNTLEALLGAYLVRRFANGPAAFARTQDAFKFLILAALLSTTVAATIGVTALCIGGFGRWSNYLWIWLTWWLGDAAGELLVVPLILLWAGKPHFDWTGAKIMEAGLMLVSLVLTAGVVFGGWLPLSSQRYPLDFPCVPVLLWAAFRFGPRETAAVNFLSTTIAVAGTLNGYGPFANGSRNEALLLLQSFAGLTQIMAIAVATEIAQRRRLDLEQRRARESAEAQNRTKDEFLMMLGHELRNPLHAISLAVRLLDRGASDSHSGPAHAIIERQTRHLSRLVDDLLDVSRVTSGRIVLNLKAIELDACIAECITALRATGQLNDRQLETQIDDVWVNGDADRIMQIVSNLLDNAIKYTAPGGRITVSMCAEDGEAVLRVNDDGIGIDGALMPRIFELFARGGAGAAEFPRGLGIGLTLVKRLVALHGGSVAAVSDGRDRGSTFIVRLPILAEPHTAAPAIAPPALTTGPEARVLVVEDNEDARSSLRTLLENRGYAVCEAADGPSGVALALSLRPDLALVDIGLPGFDGYEVARRIRAQAPGIAITLIAISGYALREHHVGAGSAFDDYLTKPLDLAKLETWLSSVAAKLRARAA